MTDHSSPHSSPLPEVDYRELMAVTTDARCDFVEGVATRPVGVDTGPEGTAALTSALSGPLPEDGQEPTKIVQRLAELAPIGVVASRGPRFGGFVVGGVHPAAEAADNLVSCWDQFAATHNAAPLISIAERTALGWLAEIGGLTDGGAEISGGFTTGTTESHIVGLAAARHHIYAELGYDVGERGMRDAPAINVLVPDTVHRSLEHALSVLGFGRGQARRISTDELGRIDIRALASELAWCDGPVILCAAAGEINTGAFDDLHQVANLRDQVRAIGTPAWMHVDGAFGYLTAASKELAHLTAGIGRADTVAFDAHKGLQCPYDCGVIFCAHPGAHAAAMSTDAAYTTVGPQVDPTARYDAMNTVLGMARRGRGLPAYAALLAVGRAGLGAVQDQLHRNAVRLAEQIDGQLGIRVASPVIWNQVPFEVTPSWLSTRDVHRVNQAVIEELQRDGTTWLGGTEFDGRPMLRYSMCNYTTTDADVDAIATAIRNAVVHVRGRRTAVASV